MEKAVARTEVSLYKDRLEVVFKDVGDWLKGSALDMSREEITIVEDVTGEYSVDKLILKKDGQKIAEIIPVGTCILGANGRIDIVGKEDRLILVDLNEGGPGVTVSGSGSTQVRKFYKGIESDGWYWIDRSSSRGYKVNEDVLKNLISEASGYVFE